MSGSLDDFALGKLAALEAEQLRRRLVASDRPGPTRLVRAGREMISFCDNDYLNLSHHPAVIAAAHAALESHGAGAGASRLVTGNPMLYDVLETRLAALKGTEDAVVFGSGYLANLGLIPCFAGPRDLVVIDELAHACLHAGSALARARTLAFRHNDLAHAEEILAAHRAASGRALIVTDGVFSMDGDLAPLPGLAALAERFQAWLMTDDAHGIGIVGGGRGSSFAFGPERIAVPLQMGTLSKAVGVYGGYLCASRPVVDWVRTRARSLIYSTGLPPPVIAAAGAALAVIQAEPDLCARPRAKAARFCAALGLPAPQSSIVPLLLGDAGRALAASAALAEAGFIVTAIRPPTVPAGTARLRFTFTAAHRDDDIDRLAALVAGLIERP